MKSKNHNEEKRLEIMIVIFYVIVGILIMVLLNL